MREDHSSSWEIRMVLGELTDKEFAFVSAFTKHIRNRIDEWKGDEDGWQKLTEEIDEFLEVSGQGLSSSLISKLYTSGPS